MARTKKIYGPRCLLIYCASTAIFLIIVVAVVTTLSVTVFKRRSPDVDLENIQMQYLADQEIIKVDLVVAINNQNYGSFKYRNTTAFLHYRGNVVAEIPIQNKTVPARGKLNFNTSGNITAEKLLTNPHLWDDLISGSLNFTSNATLDGKIRVLKIIKIHGKAFSTCGIFYLFPSLKIKSTCNTKIKL